MVLNGIGGNTIAEAKEKITYTEALIWNAYIQKRGSLNIGRRVEIATAYLCVLISRVNGGKLTFDDVAPHEVETDQTVIDQVLKEFGSALVISEANKEQE